VQSTDVDLEIARAAIIAARRQVLAQLFGAAMQQNEPERREAIMATISRVLAQGKEWHARA
jgi:hypothetical protein